MSDIFAHFHFLRPFWLLILPIFLCLWWIIRRGNQQRSDLPPGIAPHLAAALQVNPIGTRRILPIDGVALCGVLLAFATAGPAWTRLANPLLADTAPLVVAFKITPSMEQTDLAPSRLDRARFKIIDLINSRAGARTALIAYAGSAHQVAPLTEDANILRPLLESLQPRVMPREGDAPATALALGRQILSKSDVPGAILFVLDDFNPSDLAAFTATSEIKHSIFFMIAAPDSTTLPQLAQIKTAKVLHLAPNDSDLAQISRWLDQAYVGALSGDERLQWQDRGWWLAWPAAFLALIWFRRGWTMRWALLLVVMPLLTPTNSHAEGWKDWFLTPDQQGQRAMNRKEFDAASRLFNDPLHRGYALMKAGQYAEAAEIFSGHGSFDAAMGEGLSLIRNRKYRLATAAFETALERQPDDPDALNNLSVSNAILDYVETAREQSDTGEDSGIGADDVVFDNDAQRGTKTTVQAQDQDAAPQTAEQWMSSIDTDMGDFLRFRFRLDLSENGK
ncbi:hypothetical protein A9Q94_12280 [Rhodobacterales bacterium 56_14_T64]|nr:hypothetical protein A9Q94_12280 [Rhodobacterales bacterium 56_14_T64]